MRCVAYNFPESDDSSTREYANQLKLFYYSLQLLLPCNTCQANFRTHLRQYPIDTYLKSRDSIMNWVNLIYDETAKVAKQDKSVGNQVDSSSSNKKEQGKGINYTVKFNGNCPNCNKNK